MHQPEIGRLVSAGLDEDIASAMSKYLETGDESVARKAKLPWYIFAASDIAAVLLSKIPWGDTARGLVRFLILLSSEKRRRGGDHHVLLLAVIKTLLEAEVSVPEEVELEILGEVGRLHGDLDEFMGCLFESSLYSYEWNLAPDHTAVAPFASETANFIHRFVSRPGFTHLEWLAATPLLFKAIALYNPDLTRAWCLRSPSVSSPLSLPVWRAILDTTDQYDDLCRQVCMAGDATTGARHFDVLHHLNEARAGRHADFLVPAAEHCHDIFAPVPLQLLIRHHGGKVLPVLTAWLRGPQFHQLAGEQLKKTVHLELFALVESHWDSGGREFIETLLSRIQTSARSGFADVPGLVLTPLTEAHFEPVRAALLRRFEECAPPEQTELWAAAAAARPEVFRDDFEAMLSGKSGPRREIAARAIIRMEGDRALERADALLASTKADARLGAVALLQTTGLPEAAPRLRAALDVESHEAVRAKLHEALAACGGSPPSSAEASEGDVIAGLLALHGKTRAKSIPSWFTPALQHPLVTLEGVTLPDEAVKALVCAQARHKAMSAAPDIAPLLPYLDRTRCAPFALAALEVYLGTEQAAGDRWAMALAGLLGDARLIPPLLSRIPAWCDNARHKLAEYAAQTIALLPGNEPLMVLDALANRYRNKFANVGKSCAAAFQSAASARGNSPEELADMVAPAFEFGGDGRRVFSWNGGAIAAELCDGGKLSWSAPDGEKNWQSLPDFVPAEVKADIKVLGKLIREAVKAQTARHELALVFQRRWPVARWRELYEHHPLLRLLVVGLVWGVYDPSGRLLRTFRRYHNGILADARGQEDELADNGAMVGLVHPLELDPALAREWRDHLVRLKLKPLIPQLDRPVEPMDPLHANRREITLCRDQSLASGTFRSRAEKRGWFRGSVVDAGGISSYVKSYPLAGVEVILPTENFFIGMDPTDTLKLGAACFVRVDSVRRGSYTYDEPSLDDPRVLRFGEVPAVVYSETIGDLKAIIATRET